MIMTTWKERVAAHKASGGDMTLVALLELAKSHTMTEAELEEQRISWLCGEIGLDQQKITIADLSKPVFYYLASPYSGGADETLRQARAEQANEYAAQLLLSGVFTYQAIWSTHAMAQRHELPKEHEFWVALNKAFIDPSAGVIVCDMDGVFESRGVKQEIEYAKSISKPLFICDHRRDYLVSKLEW